MIDMELYGGKRAYLTHLIARFQSVVGVYSDLTRIDWWSVDRLVFVCKGNICRSPYGAAKARALGINAVSFGLEAIDGATADGQAARSAAQRQIDLSMHRSARFFVSELRPNDLVLLFEPLHLATYRKVAWGSPAKASLLGLWTHPRKPYISDPFGKSDRYFRECFSTIDSGLQKISEKIALHQ